MGYKDLHLKPFDKGTMAKLEIFEDYTKVWLPTFIMKGDKNIHIFDLFSGPGYDCNQVPGTPIRILRNIYDYLANIFQNGTKITLHLNEFEPKKKNQEKFEALKENCNGFVKSHPKFKYFLEIKYYNEDASTLFFKLLPQINDNPSLVFLDQNGVKFISKELLTELENSKTTDFLYFVSSSYFKWLGETEEFKRILDLDPEEIKKTKQSQIHRLILQKLKSQLKEDSELLMFPFSIKKGANVYGIIFGASHYRAVDKFLEISWKKNELNGEANYDIDNDLKKSQMSMFDDQKMTKIEGFKNDLEEKLLNKSITNNEEALLYTYNSGNFYRHANDLLKALKKEKKIDYEGKTPGINYKYVFNHKFKRIISYKVNK